ncbi:MAG: ketoacyl-ACP synthase III [Opitutales bacterium]|nr:ketoacyl-ACP synthase III [Opitutales bacterium]
MPTNSSVYIRGLGVYTPEKRLSNDDLSKIVDTSDEWIRTRTGIVSRCIAADGEAASDLGLKAAERAIADAGISKDEIDMVIVSTVTPDYIFPSTACVLQNKLGISGCPAFDILTACSGFIYLLELGSRFLRGNAYRNILLVSTEKLSSVVNWKDRNTCVLFGDAAGAVVLSKTDEADVGVLGTVLGADGAYGDLLKQPAGGSALPASYETVANGQHFIQMQGSSVFKHAVRTMSECSLELLKKCNLTAEDIRWVIPHQANMRIVDAVARQLEIPMEKFCVNLQNYGNTSSASIPNCMAEMREQGRFKPGDLLLLTAFGGGFTWGASLIRWK